MVTDPIADMLNGLRTAARIGREKVLFPYSGFKLKIASVLAREGYVGEVSKKTRKGLPIIEVSLLYTESKKPKIQGTLRISKPSRRIYCEVERLGFYHRNLGALVLSTPKGLMTQKEARKEHVGGEVLFRIW